MSVDVIEIDGLVVRTIIGIFEEERDRKQEVVIHLRLDTDARRAAATDAIEDALDYKRITKRVIDFVENSSFQLIETLAERIAELVLAEFPSPRVTVRLQKPGALRFARNVGIHIVRERSGPS